MVYYNLGLFFASFLSSLGKILLGGIGDPELELMVILIPWPLKWYELTDMSCHTWIFFFFFLYFNERAE